MAGLRIHAWTLLLFVLHPGISLAAGEPAIEGQVTIVDHDGRPVPHHDDVVIFLDELEHPAPAAIPADTAVIRQRNKRFDPEIMPILAGTTVEFPNDDTVFHNIFSLSKIQPFDLGLYQQGASRSVTFSRPGLVKVYCNIHPQMIAYILVLPNLHFTMTDARGRFILPDVPLGKATVRSWYPRSREQAERAVIVAEGGIQDLQLNFVESLRFEIHDEAISIRHKNKWGQEYPAEY